MRSMTAILLLPILSVLWSCSSPALRKSSTEIRFNLISPSRETLPEVRDDLAVFTVNICNAAPNVYLRELAIEETVTRRRYLFRPYESQVRRPWRRFVARTPPPPTNMRHVEVDGVVQHTLFLELPAGNYQVTDLLFERNETLQPISLSSADDVDGVYFWHDDNVMISYLGELNVWFRDGFSSGPVLFVSHAVDHYVGDIRARYPAVTGRDIDDGNLWIHGPSRAQMSGEADDRLCRFPHEEGSAANAATP